MFIEAAVFIIGLILLVKGADLFVGGGSGLASRFGIAPALIGFTIVAFGTSLPEFVVSAQAALTGSPEIATGNIIGSNIANIALVLAICGILHPKMLNPRDPHNSGIGIQTALMLAATALFCILAWSGTLSSVAGAVFLIAFILILRLLWKKGGADEIRTEAKGYLDYLMTAGGIAAVIIGAHLVVTSAVVIATALGVSAFVIGMTLVAVGTSLPELATSVVAITRGQGGLSVGNLLGSNIFNLLFVMGIITLITPVPIDAHGDLLIMALFSAAAIPITLAGEKLTRVVSTIVLIGYCIYIGVLAGII
jgi:cation:H+ antiporter